MASAIQTPLRHREGTQLGGRVFRKQVLPYATVEKGGRRITFDRDYCARLVDAFKGRAFPQVPFVLVDPRTNEHVEDPERYRGEVKGLELSGDGLDAVLELSEAGARLVEANPRLGVSVRIVEDQERADGRRIPLAIKHVAGTLDPEIGSLREWERLSDLSADYGQSGVVDMTSATYPDEMPETPIFTDEEAKALKALLAERGGKDAADPSTTTTEPEAKPAKSPQEREQEIAAEMAALYAEHPELASSGSDPGGESETTAAEREPAGAALSAESQRKLDLAAEQAKRASDEAADLRRQLAEKDFEAERRSYVLAGVPKAAVDLAAPALKHRGTIDLSHGEKAEPGKIVRGLLDLLKGTIDLSGARGSESPDPDGDAATAEHERLAKLYAEKFGAVPGATA